MRKNPASGDAGYSRSNTAASIKGLNLKTQIHGRSRMRQRARGDPVHARFGEFSHVIERDSSGSFGANLARRGVLADLAHGLAHEGWAHVVEQYDIGAVRKRGAQFVQVCDFDFNPPGAALGRLRRGERRRNASRQANMVFLDQDGFAEVLAVVFAAAHADRVFFEGAQARRRFSRIQNLRAGAFDRADEAARKRRDPAEPLQEIQGHALARQKRARRSVYLGGNFARRNFLTVAGEDLRFGCRVQKTKYLDEQLNPGQDQRRFGDDLAPGALRGRYRRFRGDVAGSNIFGEKRPQQIVARGRVE